MNILDAKHSIVYLCPQCCFSAERGDFDTTDDPDEVPTPVRNICPECGHEHCEALTIRDALSALSTKTHSIAADANVGKLSGHQMAYALWGIEEIIDYAVEIIHANES